MAHEFLALAYEQKGMHHEAIAEFQKAISLSGDSLHIRAELGHAYAVAGKEQEALKIMDELKALSKETYVSPYDVTMIYVGLDQKDRAFDWLQKAYESVPFKTRSSCWTANRKRFMRCCRSRRIGYAVTLFRDDRQIYFSLVTTEQTSG